MLLCFMQPNWLFERILGLLASAPVLLGLLL
jgi:hypothetical protein